eukprot:m.250912 g.250912  ORF g.250912 m.250912 type:complete len:130 (+) comp15888_c0_seq1:192-581(+)
MKPHCVVPVRQHRMFCLLATTANLADGLSRAALKETALCGPSQSSRVMIPNALSSGDSGCLSAEPSVLTPRMTALCSIAEHGTVADNSTLNTKSVHGCGAWREVSLFGVLEFCPVLRKIHWNCLDNEKY